MRFGFSGLRTRRASSGNCVRPLMSLDHLRGFALRSLGLRMNGRFLVRNDRVQRPDYGPFSSFTKAVKHSSIHERVARCHHTVEKRGIAASPSHDETRRPVVLRQQEQGPTRSGTVGQRLPEHQRSSRLNLGNGHELTGLSKIRVGRKADRVAHLQPLPRWNERSALWISALSRFSTHSCV